MTSVNPEFDDTYSEDASFGLYDNDDWRSVHSGAPIDAPQNPTLIKKTTSSGSHRIYRRFNKAMKTRSIDFYHTSQTPGRHIRHAISGIYTPYLVGTRDEDLFFKVIFATGELGPESLTLFFHTPREFEVHFRVHIEEERLNQWREKQEIYLEYCQETEQKQTMQALNKLAGAVIVK